MAQQRKVNTGSSGSPTLNEVQRALDLFGAAEFRSVAADDSAQDVLDQIDPDDPNCARDLGEWVRLTIEADASCYPKGDDAVAALRRDLRAAGFLV